MGKVSFLINICDRYFFSKKWERPLRVVQQDLLRRGIEASFKTLLLLARFSSHRYYRFLLFLDEIKNEKKFTKLEISGSLYELENVFSSLDFYSFTLSQIEGEQLVLDNLTEKINKWKKLQTGKSKASSRSSVSQEIKDLRAEIFRAEALIAVLREEFKLFDKVAKNPQADVEKVFRAFDHGKGKLGFETIDVYRANRKDQLSSLREIIEQLETSSDGMLERDEELWIKITSKFGTEGWIRLAPFSFSNSAVSQMLKEEIKLYFEEMERVITLVRERGLQSGLEDTGKPYNANYFLLPEVSRHVEYKKLGKTITMEIVDNPMKQMGHLLNTFYKFIYEIALNAWGRFPKNFIQERLMAVTNAVFIRVDNEIAAYASARNVKVKEQEVKWIEIAITKKKFQQLGLQTRAFYILFREAYLEQLAKYLAGRGRWSMAWNIIKSLPELVWALLFVVGIVRKAPPNLSKIKVPVGCLAVQPVSLHPFLLYMEDIYPNPYKPEVKPSPEKVEIAKACVPAHARFDDKTFVLEGDYQEMEHLIVDQSRPPGEGGVLDCPDPIVNEFMRRQLIYDGKSGRDQVVVMNVTLADFRRYFEVQRKRKIEEKMRRKILQGTKDL